MIDQIEIMINHKTKLVEMKEQKFDDVLLKLDMKTFGRVTVSLPFFSLIYCLLSAVIFQYDQVNDTQCNVSPGGATLKGRSWLAVTQWAHL